MTPDRAVSQLKLLQSVAKRQRRCFFRPFVYMDYYFTKERRRILFARGPKKASLRGEAFLLSLARSLVLMASMAIVLIDQFQTIGIGLHSRQSFDKCLHVENDGTLLIGKSEDGF